jgi:photosystem II stability/assembly factor-like uncharacterized protein
MFPPKESRMKAHLVPILAVGLALILACSSCPISFGGPEATPIPPTIEPTQPPPSEAPPSPTSQPMVPSQPPSGPAPTDLEAAFVSIQMLDASAGWAIAGAEDELQHVLFTGDGGSTWRDVTPPQAGQTSGQLLGTAEASFVSAETAWVTYFDENLYPGTLRLLHSGNGGRTWEPTAEIQLLSYAEFYTPSLWFADDDSGWFLAEGYTPGLGGHWDTQLYRTTNGGATWDHQTIDGCGRTQMDFSDPENGWLTEGCRGPYIDPVAPSFWVTDDGGAHFQHLSLPIPDQALALDPPDRQCTTGSPQLFSVQAGVLIVACYEHEADATPNEFLFPTSNEWLGDIVWFPYPGGTLQMVSQDVGWATGRILYRTRDGGQSWGQVSTVEWDGQFSFIDDQQGWAVAQVGNQGLLLHTADGGWTWQEVNPQILP